MFREKRIANGISYYKPTLVARTGTCALPEFWRSQRSRAHKPPPQPEASPDADPQMHVWSVRYGRCARAKTSGIRVQPRHPPGCLVNPRDPGRAVWQYPEWAPGPSKRGPTGRTAPPESQYRNPPWTRGAHVAMGGISLYLIIPPLRCICLLCRWPGRTVRPGGSG